MEAILYNYPTRSNASLKWCLWKKHNITIKTKIRLFRTLIIPILLYGSETWTTLKSDVKKLETFQLRCLGQILGASLCDHYRNETVRMKCDNQPLIKEQIQNLGLPYPHFTCCYLITHLTLYCISFSKPVILGLCQGNPNAMTELPMRSKE